MNQTILIFLAVEDEDEIGLGASEIGLWYEGDCYAVLEDPHLYRSAKRRTVFPAHSLQLIKASNDRMIYKSGRLRVLAGEMNAD